MMTDQITDDVNHRNEEGNAGGSSSSSQDEQDALRRFIEEYELSPELWNPTSPLYLKKAARSAALDRLIPFLVKIKPGADKREDVKKNINSLRTNYRKQLKKIAVSKRSGSSTDKIYTPSSWVFFVLSFLERVEQPVQQEQQQQTEPAVEKVSEQEQDGAETQEADGNNSQQSSGGSASRSSMRSPPFTPGTRNKKSRLQGPIAKQNNLLEKACAFFERSPNPDSNIPTIAKAWGEKLLTLEPRQRAYAEKAINDILFEATLGNLNRDSFGINPEYDFS